MCYNHDTTHVEYFNLNTMTISICNSEMEQIGVVKPGDTGVFETPSGRQLNVLSQGWGEGFRGRQRFPRQDWH